MGVADVLRSPISRTSTLAPCREPKPAPGPRMRRCSIKACRTPFQPMSITHKVCGPACALIYAKAESKRREAKADRARKQAAKTRGDHIADTQVAFNAYIRARDQAAGHACISSGRPLDWSGNNVDAGHYRSRGSAPHLRFDERNVHAQSKQENRYASGNATDYRIGLIARIGLAAVEALEQDQAGGKWTIPQLLEMKAHYRAKTKALRLSAPDVTYSEGNDFDSIPDPELPSVYDQDHI